MSPETEMFWIGFLFGGLFMNIIWLLMDFWVRRRP